MDEIEVRCGGCASRGHKPTLLATVHGDRVLVPVRIGNRKAKAGGVARTGMFWSAAAMDGAVALLRCRRCRTLTRYDASRATMASAARSDALPSVAQ